MCDVTLLGSRALTSTTPWISTAESLVAWRWVVFVEFINNPRSFILSSFENEQEKKLMEAFTSLQAMMMMITKVFPLFIDFFF